MVDPRRLELLLELSRLGSMREVSEAMGITTSTVSQQIAVLAREANRPRRLTCSPRTRPASFGRGLVSQPLGPSGAWQRRPLRGSALTRPGHSGWPPLARVLRLLRPEPAVT